MDAGSLVFGNCKTNCLLIARDPSEDFPGNWGDRIDPPTLEEFAEEMRTHFYAMLDFYGPENGVRISRKTLLEYLRGRGFPGELRASVSFLNSAEEFEELLKAVRCGPSPRYWQMLEQNPRMERRLGKL